MNKKIKKRKRKKSLAKEKKRNVFENQMKAMGYLLRMMKTHTPNIFHLISRVLAPCKEPQF